MDQLYQWFLCIYSISIVLAHLLLNNQSGPNFHQILSTLWDNSTLCNVENLLSIYNSTGWSCGDCYIFYLFEQCFIQQIRSSSHLKSRVSNLTLSFPRVYRAPIEVITGIQLNPDFSNMLLFEFPNFSGFFFGPLDLP